MFVKETRYANGRVNLAIIEGRWERGQSRQRTVRKLGYVDVLEKDHDDARAWAEELCNAMNAERAAAKAAVAIEIHPREKIDARIRGAKNIGVAIPLFYYNSLGIERTIRNHTRELGIEYDPNAVMRLLCAERLMDPGSKLAAWSRRDRYFFRSDFSDDDAYRALDIFAKSAEAIVAGANRAIARMHRRNLKSVYYDVTNYYFEIDSEDDLRKKGVSKEHRPKPIIQMGLAQDSDGIPLGFQIFPGNTCDCETMLPVMKAMRKETGGGRVIMVADKGLNTSTNIAAIMLDKNGFVFSQSIRGRKSPKELREWVISDKGYRVNKDDRDGVDFKCKSRQDVKLVHVLGPDEKTKDVDIDVKVVAFWSSKYARRAKYERAKTIEKARALADDPTRYDRAIHYGATRYIKGITIDKKTGEMLADAGSVPCIDEDMIAAEERLDGYYVIVTSECGMEDGQIIDTYRGLWRIEESFKVTKSCLRARPVFVWTDAHIRAHFLICYIALVITRLMQYDTGFKYGAEAILENIAQMTGTHLEDNWWVFSHRNEITDELCRTVGINLTRRYMQLSEIRHEMSKARPR
jgi:transposase